MTWLEGVRRDVKALGGGWMMPETDRFGVVNF